MSAKRGILPSEPGVYWCRSTGGHKWYDLIVEVTGEVPFLHISNILNDGTAVKTNYECWELYWGPKIAEPTVPKEEIEK